MSDNNLKKGADERLQLELDVIAAEYVVIEAAEADGVIARCEALRRRAGVAARRAALVAAVEVEARS